MSDEDSLQARQFSEERNTDFVYMIAYMPDSVNENQLLYEVARYNFTSYLVRNFDIEIEDDGGLHRMTLRGFRNYDEALQYARALHKDAPIVRSLRGGRSIVISQENLQLLGTRYSYDDYDAFYNEHFAPLPVSDLPLLLEPILEEEEEEEAPPQPEESEGTEETENSNFTEDSDQSEYFDNVDNIDKTDKTDKTDDIIIEEEKKLTPDKTDDDIIIIEEEKKLTPDKTDDDIIIPVDDKTKKPVIPNEIDDEYYDFDGF